jgi:16S rRNA (cytosine1402-N4)-methyltransferase
VGGFDGILFDLGVSSFQLDTPERGFSFRNDAPADMRMNPRTGLPAWQLIDESDRETLEKIVRDLGEEPRWRPVVKALEEAKGSEKIRTTLGLAEVIAAQAKYGGKLHPATRVFMGLRMAVNDEIGRLERALPKAFEALADGGILAVISFHSIEDRVVKIFFQSVTRPKDSAPAKLLLKKVGRPEKDETAMNARSRSAKLRVLQKNTSQ